MGMNYCECGSVPQAKKPGPCRTTARVWPNTDLSKSVPMSPPGSPDLRPVTCIVFARRSPATCVQDAKVARCNPTINSPTRWPHASFSPPVIDSEQICHLELEAPLANLRRARRTTCISPLPFSPTPHSPIQTTSNPRPAPPRPDPDPPGAARPRPPDPAEE